MGGRGDAVVHLQVGLSAQLMVMGQVSPKPVALSESCHQAQVQVRATLPPARWWRVRGSCKRRVATREMQNWRVPLLTYYHSACLDAFISCLDSWPTESIHQMLELPPASCKRKLLWSARMQNWTVPLFRKCCSIVGWGGISPPPALML